MILCFDNAFVSNDPFICSDLKLVSSQVVLNLATLGVISQRVEFERILFATLDVLSLVRTVCSFSKLFFLVRFIHDDLSILDCAKRYHTCCKSRRTLLLEACLCTSSCHFPLALADEGLHSCDARHPH